MSDKRCCFKEQINQDKPPLKADSCNHEWCDIAVGGQYCRLCDQRRSEQDKQE